MSTPQQRQRGRSSYVWVARLRIHSTNISWASPECQMLVSEPSTVSVLLEHTTSTGRSYQKACLSLSGTFRVLSTHEPHMPSGRVIGIWYLSTMLTTYVLHLDMLWFYSLFCRSSNCSTRAREFETTIIHLPIAWTLPTLSIGVRTLLRLPANNRTHSEMMCQVPIVHEKITSLRGLTQQSFI